MSDPIFDPERRYNNVARCDWCQLLANEGDWVVFDKLILHNKPILRQEKSCLDLYKNYCKWIREKTE